MLKQAYSQLQFPQMSHTLIRARAVINIVSMSRENNELGFLEGLSDFKNLLKNFMNSSTEGVRQYQDQTIVVVGARVARFEF